MSAYKTQTYKVQTTNMPVDEKGNAVDPFMEVTGAELVDLQRLGLVVPDKGDIDKKGILKKELLEDAPQEVVTAFPTGPIPTVPPAA